MAERDLEEEIELMLKLVPGGWGRRHSVVDYVFRHEPSRLYAYHLLVMDEMARRNFTVASPWFNWLYRGKALPPFTPCEAGAYLPGGADVVYPEHDDGYLLECLENLKAKGAELVGGASIGEMLLTLAVKGVTR